MLHFSILVYPDGLQKSIYQPDIEIDFCNLLRISIPQSYYILQKQCLSRILIVFFIPSSYMLSTGLQPYKKSRKALVLPGFSAVLLAPLAGIEPATNPQEQTRYDIGKWHLMLKNAWKYKVFQHFKSHLILRCDS